MKLKIRGPSVNLRLMGLKTPDRAWNYWIDADGRFWHEGTELDDPALLKFFMEKMKLLPDGRYHVLCQGEDCYFTAQDVPYVIQTLNVTPNRVELLFPGAYQEDLNPKTLEVGKENVLYCKIRGGDFKARFNRKSYLELAKGVHFDATSRTYFLPLGGASFPIRGVKT